MDVKDLNLPNNKWKIKLILKTFKIDRVTMEYLSVECFTRELEKVNYEITPDDLKVLVSRLTHDASHVLKSLLEYVQSIGYEDSCIIYDDDDEPVLDVYTGFSGLQFKLNSSLQLVLIEVMWYDRGCESEGCNFVVGNANYETISSIIELYTTRGKAVNNTNPSIESLMQQN